MVTLADMALAAATGSVAIRGKDYPVQPLTARESTRILRAFPRPNEPKAGDSVPAYRSALSEWQDRTLVMEAAAGLRFKTAAGLTFDGALASDQAMMAWGLAAAEELGGTLTDQEVSRIVRAMSACTEAATEQAAKN